MAELKFPKASVFHTFTLQTELIDPPVIKLELTPIDGKDKYRNILSMMEVKGIGDVKKMSPETQLKLIDAFDKLVPLVSRHVIGWDLTINNGISIPCTDGEKAIWLEPLLWEMVEPEATAGGFDPGDDEEKTGGWLWSAIMEIISDRRNFLKN